MKVFHILLIVTILASCQKNRQVASKSIEQTVEGNEDIEKDFGECLISKDSILKFQTIESMYDLQERKTPCYLWFIDGSFNNQESLVEQEYLFKFLASLISYYCINDKTPIKEVKKELDKITRFSAERRFLIMESIGSGICNESTPVCKNVCGVLNSVNGTVLF